MGRSHWRRRESYLTIKGAAAAAIDFYKAAFGAQELYRQPAPDGERVFHASLLINGALVYLSDDFPDDPASARDPKSLGGTPVTIHLRIPENVDEVWQRAVIAGATVVMSLEKQECGDRYGMLEDPFGHRCSLAEPGPPQQG